MKYYQARALIAFSIFFLVALSCGAPFLDIPYYIVAAYRANSSGYQIDIKAQGVVPAGADISDHRAAQVQISPITSLGLDLEFEIDFTGMAVVSVSGQPKRSINWHKYPHEELYQILAQAGYRNLSKDEIDETIKVINGAMAGPKGMILEGQTTRLVVINVQNNP